MGPSWLQQRITPGRPDHYREKQGSKHRKQDTRPMQKQDSCSESPEQHKGLKNRCMNKEYQTQAQKMLASQGTCNTLTFKLNSRLRRLKTSSEINFFSSYSIINTMGRKHEWKERQKRRSRELLILWDATFRCRKGDICISYGLVAGWPCPTYAHDDDQKLKCKLKKKPKTNAGCETVVEYLIFQISQRG